MAKKKKNCIRDEFMSFERANTDKTDTPMGLSHRLYHSAAMLSLKRIKSSVFSRQASARREFSARLAVQKQSFLFS